MPYTYEKRLGIRNTFERPVTKHAAKRAGKPELEGVVFDWWTREGGKILMVPDQWADGKFHLPLEGEIAVIPDDLEATKWSI